MNRKAIIFDLDDTLINTKKRHYNLIFRYITENIKMEPPKYHEYLSIRSKYGLSNMEFLSKFYKADPSSFNAFWIASIEHPDYLKFDEPIIDSSLLLKLRINSEAIFILMSLRTNKLEAKNQFSNFEFAFLFDEVFFLAHSLKNPKQELLKELKSKYDILYFIGDSQIDLQASEDNGVRFISLESGFSSQKKQSKDTWININHFIKNEIKNYEHREK